MGRGWADIYITKGVTDALVLTIRELRNFQLSVKNKAMATPYRVYYMQPSLASDASCVRLLWGYYIYLHRRGASGIARFDRQGNAKTYESWNGQQSGSTFCVLYITNTIIVIQLW